MTDSVTLPSRPIGPSARVLTPEQIAKTYTSVLDSVDLINQLVSSTTKTVNDADTIKRNVDHLVIIVAKTFWTTEDLTPLHTAITAGNTCLESLKVPQP